MPTVLVSAVWLFQWGALTRVPELQRAHPRVPWQVNPYETNQINSKHKWLAQPLHDEHRPEPDDVWPRRDCRPKEWLRYEDVVIIASEVRRMPILVCPLLLLFGWLL